MQTFWINIFSFHLPQQQQQQHRRRPGSAMDISLTTTRWGAPATPVKCLREACAAVAVIPPRLLDTIFLDSFLDFCAVVVTHCCCCFLCLVTPGTLVAIHTHLMAILGERTTSATAAVVVVAAEPAKAIFLVNWSNTVLMLAAAVARGWWWLLPGDGWHEMYTPAVLLSSSTGVPITRCSLVCK